MDASTSSANVLMINPNAEEVVLPCRTCIGQLVHISAVSVAQPELQLPTNTAVVLPEYLEDIVQGSHIGEECTLPMDIGLPKQQSDLPDSITSPYAIWVRDALEVAYDQVRQHSARSDYMTI